MTTAPTSQSAARATNLITIPVRGTVVARLQRDQQEGPAAAVPEPATLVLLGLGIVAAGIARRTRAA